MRIMTYPSHYEPVPLRGGSARPIGPTSYVFDDAYAGEYRFSSGPPLLHLKLQLKWVPNAGFAGDLVAQKYGRRWSNVDLELLRGEPGSDSIERVLHGRADFGVTTGDQLILALGDNLPVVAVGRVYQQNPLAWVSKAESGIDGPAALSGRLIGLTDVDDRHVLSALLDKGGLAADHPTVPVTGDDLGRFLADEIDAYPIYINTQGTELDILASTDGVRFSYLIPEDLGIHAYSNVYFTTASMVKDYPEVVQRFANLVSAGWQFSLDHPARAAAVVRAEKISISSTAVEQSVAKTLKLVRPPANGFIGQMSLDGWNQTQEMLIRSRQLDMVTPLERHFTNRFMWNAHERLRAA
jgi:NitT/TauT family transport system substrate-binding protein